LGYILLQTARVWLQPPIHYNTVGSETDNFRQKTPQNGHNAVQEHSRSLILVPIESLYTTSFHQTISYHAPFSGYCESLVKLVGGELE